MMKRALFANWINTIAVSAGLLLMRNFEGFCSTMKRAIYGTLGRFGINLSLTEAFLTINDFLCPRISS